MTVPIKINYRLCASAVRVKQSLFLFQSYSVRNGIPGKEGLFIISVTSGSLADKTGARVSY